jgi:hypothetical protein
VNFHKLSGATVKGVKSLLLLSEIIKNEQTTKKDATTFK